MPTAFRVTVSDKRKKQQTAPLMQWRNNQGVHICNTRCVCESMARIDTFTASHGEDSRLTVMYESMARMDTFTASHGQTYSDVRLVIAAQAGGTCPARLLLFKCLQACDT